VGYVLDADPDGGLFSTGAACRFTVMNAAHRAGTTKMLNDIWVTCLILRFVSWFEFGFAGHEAISTGRRSPAGGLLGHFNPSILMTMA